MNGHCVHCPPSNCVQRQWGVRSPALSEAKPGADVRRSTPGFAAAQPGLHRCPPRRSPASRGALRMNVRQGLLREASRGVGGGGGVGVRFSPNARGKPLTAPKPRPLFELMAKLDLPIWLHPARGADFPDYQKEKKSHYEIWWTFGWPYETSAAMAHIVFEGLFDRYTQLKIITHHIGGLFQYFDGRVGPTLV